MANILIIFILGMIGTYLRVTASRRSINTLMLANITGVVIASILSIYDFNLLITGFCGSLTTLSTLIVIGSENKRYLFNTVMISFVLSALIFYLLG